MKVWDHREANSVMTIVGHDCNVTDVAIFPAGGVLGTTGDDGSCRIWDLRFHGTTEGPQLVQLRTDMYGLTSDAQAPPVSVEVKKGLTACTWSYSGALLIAASDDTHLYGWEAFKVTSDRGTTPPPM